MEDIHGRYFWEISFKSTSVLDFFQLSVRFHTDVTTDDVSLVLLAVKKLEYIGVSVDKLSEPLVKQIDLAEHHG